jgi:hypothetical protein
MELCPHTTLFYSGCRQYGWKCRWCVTSSFAFPLLYLINFTHAANKLFGGGNNGEQALPQTQRALDDELGPCAAPFKNFLKCVEQNPENVGSCQWGYSMYSQCRQQNGQQQM